MNSEVKNKSNGKNILIVLLALTVIGILYSCYTKQSSLKNEYTELLNLKNDIDDDNKKLKEDIVTLESELEELKFGVQNLYSDALNFYKMKDFVRSKRKIELLNHKHPNAIETSKAEKMLPKINEEILWAIIQTSDNLSYVNEYLETYTTGKYRLKSEQKKREIIFKNDKNAFDNAKTQNTITTFNTYLETYPNGEFNYNAKININRIKKENEEAAYNQIKNSNSVYKLNNFLEDYPNHWNKSNIKQRIINFEIDEITRNSKTGKMPTFSQTNYGNYSTNSNVTITNDTGYELILRYGGPTTKKIIIQPGRTLSTSLTSGQYRVTATANGMKT